MRKLIQILSVVVSSILLMSGNCYAQGMEEQTWLTGPLGGVAFTSNPPALQDLTGKSHYVDGNGGWTFLYHEQKDGSGFGWEWQFSMLLSSVAALESAENETKMKFIVPMDFRFFLGDPNRHIAAYLGAGLQYNTVWNFISQEGDSYTYYDPWWGYYYTDTTDGEDKWDWTVNQLSTNLALGFKVGFGEDCKHALILGTKFHFPIINASEYHGDSNKSIDLSRDKTNVSLTGGISIAIGRGALKFDAEYPLGGTTKYTLNDGGHSTFFNTNSWSLSATILFNCSSGGGRRRY